MNASVADARIALLDETIHAACLVTTLEVVAMGRKTGLSLATLTDVINKSTAASRVSQVLLPAIVQGKPTSDARLAAKLRKVDETISLAMVSGAPMPIASVARGLLQAAVNALGEGARVDDLAKYVESMAGTRIADEPGSTGAATVRPPAGVAAKPVVGYVGLGPMGAALARRLMLSYDVHVFDVQAEAMQAIEAEGAKLAADLPSLARACDIVLLCLPTSEVVRKVLFGEEGLAPGLSRGMIVIDQTTGDPSATRAMAAELQALGVALVDAPISGGPGGAAAGTLAILCGGAAQDRARARPLLESISKDVVECGDTGAGNTAKLVKNALGACNRLITYEAAALAVKGGLRLADIAKQVNQGVGWSKTFERAITALPTGAETARLRIELMVKDLHLACRLGLECGAPMLVANAVRGTFEEGCNVLGGGANIDEISRLFEARAGIRFTGA